jgi:WS/DGAT/MGAT family acyltransferase
MTKQRLSNADIMFLRTGDLRNPMMVTGVMVFGAPIDFEQLTEMIEDRLLRFDRFRQRVVQPRLPWATPYWEDDPGFDLGYHLARVNLPPSGDQAALQEIVSHLASTPLDLTKPLWQLHLVEGDADGVTRSYQDTSTALIFRLHHAIGDGMALVHVLLSLADPDPEARQPGMLQENQRECSPNRPGVFRAAGSLMGKGLGLLSHPSRLADKVRMVNEAATALGDLILLPSDSTPVFKAELSATKRAAWSAPIPLQDVKTVGHRLGGTVNDVLLTAMTGALRRYLVDRGQLPDDASLTAAVAVNLRPPGTEGELGNRIGFVYLALPVDIADPGDRLREVKRRMDRHKGSLEAPLGIVILKALGMVPASVQDVLVNYLGAKATVLMTNVMGPRERLYLAGVPLEALMFWLPPSGGVGVGVSILSYAGQVWLGVLTDQGLVPDPEAIIAGFQPEFDVLLSLAGEAGEPPSIREILARLDDTLITLDAILDDKPGKPEPNSGAAPAAPQ